MAGVLMAGLLEPQTKYTMSPTMPLSEMEIRIPDELDYLLAEAAEDLEITPDELVPQAVSSYSRERKGGPHE
jgi:hypothetical protein